MTSSSSLVVIFKVEWEGFTSPQGTYDITRNTELNMAGTPFSYKTPFIDCHKLLKKIKVELKYFKLMNSFSDYSNQVCSPTTPPVKSVVNEKNGIPFAVSTVLWGIRCPSYSWQNSATRQTDVFDRSTETQRDKWQKNKNKKKTSCHHFLLLFFLHLAPFYLFL